MTEAQVKNLYHFICINLEDHQGDYVIDKYCQMIGIPLRSDGILASDERFYNKYTELPYGLGMFLSKIKEYKTLEFSSICLLFETFIGSVEDINKEEYKNIHIIIRNRVDDFIKDQKNIQRDLKITSII